MLLRSWLQHLWNEIRTEKGWQLFFKALFGGIALFANVMVLVVAWLTVGALVVQLKSQQWTEALGRGAKIASDLQSEKAWDRITGLRELQTYPFEFKDVTVPPQANSLAPFEFSKSAILLHFERFRLVRGDNGPEAVLLDGRDSASVQRVDRSDQFEKSLSLKVLSDLGAASWYLAQPKRPPRFLTSLDTSVQIDLHWIVTERPTSASIISDPTDIIAEKDLSGVSIVHSDLSCISIKGSRLVNLHGSQIAFFATDMSDVDLSDAQLEYVDIANATARHARFAGAQIIGMSTNVEGNVHVDLISDRYSKAETARCLTGGGGKSERKTDLTGADFRGAQLRDSYFGGALLASTDFSGAWLDGLTFGSSRRDGVTEAPAARFAGAHLYDVSFKDTDLTSSDFSAATLAGVSFKGAILDGVSFKGARIEPDDLRKLLADKPSMTGANFAGVKLSNDKWVCALLARRAVFVMDEEAWRGRGKPESSWVTFASDEMQARAAGCRSLADGQRSK